MTVKRNRFSVLNLEACLLIRQESKASLLGRARITDDMYRKYQELDANKHNPLKRHAPASLDIEPVKIQAKFT